MSATNPKFSHGQIVATPGALAALAKAGQTPHELLARHLRGDWGSVCQDDANLNELAIKDGCRLLSVYPLPTGERIYVITEATDDSGHRAATTLLLDQEY